MSNTSANSPSPGLHVLTLTPFFPSQNDDSGGCFIAEPLACLETLHIQNSVIAMQPVYRRKLRMRNSLVDADWLRYFSLPGRLGLPSAGAFLFARILGRVRSLHSKRPIRLIHAHAPLPAGHTAMLLSRELGIPFVISVHGLDVFSTNQANGWVADWSRRISRRVYAAARRVICISEHVRETILQGMGRISRTSVVYNGVNPDLFSPGPESAHDRLSILSVGNLIPIKGHDLLIRAVASLAPEFPNVSLEIIGEGIERPYLEKLTEQVGVRTKVHFHGRRSRTEVAQAMKRCTLFALPSSYEGLGCVYLEAMACGRAVIGCRGQGIAEIIQHGSNGFLVGAHNEKELTLALGILLRDSQKRQTLGISARDTILDRLTLQQQARNLARIYRECAE